ncbi:MAG: S-adenosylmethionine:tRNA ribosyltransferase-isomerase [Symbiopectobacterium sp.]
MQSVRVGTIKDHVMPAEYTKVLQEVVDAVLACKARGNYVIAVGSTSVRLLKRATQAAQDALIAPFFYDTRIFIYPCYRYRVIDALVTNFQLPESTLIMLVSAFAGYQHTMVAYPCGSE